LPKHLKILDGIWLPRAQFDSLAFTAAHKKLASFAMNCILSGRWFISTTMRRRR
jgi:hypothetical protein